LKAMFKHLRLLPFVIVVGVGLLAVKGTGLVMDARAEGAAATTPASAAPAQAATADPAGDDAETASSGEVDVLTGLSKRRAELDAREQDLTTQANLIAATEKRVDDKIAQLKTLQTQMQTLMGQRDTAEQTQINALVKTYSSMKPKDAARIFNDLDDDVLLSVAQLMKPDVLGAILAQMQADNAQKLTVRLANRLKPPAPQPQQVAALTPPATTPAATPATPAAAPAAVPANTNEAPPASQPTPATATPAPQQTASNTPPQTAASTTPPTAPPAAAKK
jgi:flagellar motility protein MotE (MotC chaperone)